LALLAAAQRPHYFSDLGATAVSTISTNAKQYLNKEEMSRSAGESLKARKLTFAPKFFRDPGLADDGFYGSRL
jgi:hypothetical protein